MEEVSPKGNIELKEMKKLIKEACESVMAIGKDPQHAVAADPYILKPFVNLITGVWELMGWLDERNGAVTEVCSFVQGMLDEAVAERTDLDSVDAGGQDIALISEKRAVVDADVSRLLDLVCRVEKLRIKAGGKIDISQEGLSRFEKIRKNNCLFGEKNNGS